MTAGEVADWLRVSRDFVFRQAREGHIPHVRLGRAVRFVPDVIRDWLAGCQEATIALQFNGAAPLTRPAPGTTKRGRDAA
jgi:excisionase family DNA binding protein